VEREKLLNMVAPCSMLCYTCMGCKDGAIATCAKKLYNYNKGVCEFRGQHMSEDERKEWHSFFNQFQETLYNFSLSECPGCRNFPADVNPFGGCIIHKCTLEHGVDFCADCSDFPCDKPKDFFDEKLLQVWENGNRRIQEIGAEAYFEEKKDTSHYSHYVESEKE